MEKLEAKRRNMNGSMISELLPEPILHKILSLLSQKDAVRTCVLSKSWRHLWYGRPEISFRRRDFRVECPKYGICQCSSQEKKLPFLSALEKTLQRYHDQKLVVEKFELQMFQVDSKLNSLLQKWIPLPLIPNMSLETFNLSFCPRSRTNFDLPWVVFQVKSLQKMSLMRCNVNHPTGGGKVLLECLQTLSLKDVFIEVDTLEMLMSSCPLIENVVLKQCKGLEAPNVIRIKHNNLKHLSFSAYLKQSYDDSPGIEMDAPNLISLHLREVQLYPNYFKNLSSNFPRLEDLSVLWCKGHGELKLSSRSIKRLDLAVHRETIKATIDAPNLHDFNFSGEFPQTSLTFAKTSSEWKSHVKLDFMDMFFEDGDLPWFLNLGELLKALSKSQISLEAGFDFLPPNQQFEEKEGGFNHGHVVVVENLRLYWTCFEEENADLSPSFPNFLNGLFSVCRPTYTQTLYNRKGLFHFLCKVLVQEREKKDYFWQKDLEEVGVEVWGKETNEWNPISMPHCELPSNDIRFRLKWRD